MPSLTRRFKDFRYRVFYGLFLSRRYPLLELGNRATGCSWNIFASGLNSDSVIYSGGVGRDITFEDSLSQRFGCSVILFDPSPTGLETMRLPENQRPQFKFDPVALAGRCGRLTLVPPQNPEEGSWFASAGGNDALEVEAVDLATLMQRHGHAHIDLLKIDIEGAEYDVLDHLLTRRLRVRQVAVEFHHSNLPGITRQQTIRAILKMRAAGYTLIDQDGNNHTFYRAAW